jgi:DNA helicase-2/ATP-dependent DNA helicase PcrA
VYVPARYYHRPHGRDDAHGYGQPSRFLTGAVQARFAVTHAAEAPAPRAEEAQGRRIEVSVDALFC